jgi:hypothetical protein
MKKLTWQSKLIIFVTIILGFLILCDTAWIKSVDIRLTHHLNPQNNDVVMTSIADGYHEECYQSHLEEKYELIDSKTTWSCFDQCEIPYNKLGPGMDIRSGTEIKTGKNHYWDNICIEKCMAKPIKPYINYWNETVCDKMILVKEVKQ